jgi:hypothetical protein
MGYNVLFAMLMLDTSSIFSLFSSTPFHSIYIVKLLCIRPSYNISIQPEVMLYDQWKDLKTDSKSGLSAWIKGAFTGSKSDMQDSVLQNLHSILSTSPMWDR